MTGLDIKRRIESRHRDKAKGVRELRLRQQQIPCEWRGKELVSAERPLRQGGGLVMALLRWRDGKWRRAWMPLGTYRTEQIYVVAENTRSST